MLGNLARALWGNLTKEEVKKFGMLSLTFFFAIGTYWLMRPLKDALFLKIVGKLYIPYAKMASVLFIIPLILVYSKLVDMVAKHKLFYVICSFYSVFFLVLSYFLAHPTIGLANTVPSKSRLLGWVIYLGIESFGSLVPALFWSFVASTTDTASAKRGYGLIIAGAQFGSILGPTIATYAEYIGMTMLAKVVAVGIFMVPVLIYFFVKAHPAAAVEHREDKKATGPIEGLRLLLSQPYLLGILGVATLYEVIGTVLDYQMKFIADETYQSVEKVTQFLGTFGQSANLLSLVFALVGTSFFIRRFGLTFCMVAFPITIGAAVCYVFFNPSLWTLFGAMVAIKGLSYALNNPCKEIMYIPTSKDVKFKAKGWIDVFGGRSSKAAGSGINAIFTNMADLMFYGSIISLGIVGVWIVIAMYVGRKNEKLIQDGSIIQ
ncbi:MAG: Npt1/Npt2 family nucleotide transporter [Candidatus Babeliales bacterium]|jgi:AAA family ATP:ADP antiporter